MQLAPPAPCHQAAFHCDSAGCMHPCELALLGAGVLTSSPTFNATRGGRIVAHLSLSTPCRQRVDFYDRNHPAGGSVDVQLQAIVHVAAHWAALVRAGRGLALAEASTREMRACPASGCVN